MRFSSWSSRIQRAGPRRTSVLGSLRTAPRTNAVLGLVSALLLSVAIRETGRELERARDQRPRAFRPRWWFFAGFETLLVGLVLDAMTPLGPGVSLLGVILIAMGVLGVLPAPPRAPQADPPLPSTSGASDTRPRLSTVGQWITAIPFLVIAVGLANVAVDRYWVGGSVGGLYFLTAAALLLGAVVSVDEYGYRPHGQWSVATNVGVWSAPAILMLLPLATLQQRNVTFTLIVSGLLGAVTLFYAYGVARGNRVGSLQLSLPLTVWASVAIAVSVHIDPLKTGKVLGTVTLINLAAGVLVVLGYGVVRAAARFRPPEVLGWLGRVRSLPVLTLFLVWWIVCGTFLPTGMHDVKVVPREVSESWPADQRRAPDLREAFNAWVRAQPELTDQQVLTAKQRSRVEAEPPVPMMLVASHGGGIRAAYWTALVLDCLVGKTRPVETGRTASDGTELHERVCQGPRRGQAEIEAAARRVFIGSGVSGGSVGLAAYAQHMLYGNVTDGSWVREKLKADFASSTVGWGLFHDLPNHMLGIASTPGECEGWELWQCLRRDRAGVLEDALDADQPETGPAQLRKTWDQRSSDDADTRTRAETVPLLVFNSTQVGGKFAVVTSAAKLGSQKLDLDESEGVRPTRDDEPLPLGGALETVDLLCSDADLKLSTAAMLSARFPLVSPSWTSLWRVR